MLCDRRMSVKLKGKAYKTVVRPALLYGAETWATSRGQEARLEVNEMRMLRCMRVKQSSCINLLILQLMPMQPILVHVNCPWPTSRCRHAEAYGRRCCRLSNWRSVRITMRAWLGHTRWHCSVCGHHTRWRWLCNRR